MTVQITIIGLGRIGGSLGLALAAHKEGTLRVGHDKDHQVERAALQKGAVDKAEHNLPSAVRGAKVVVLAMPVQEMRETLNFIAADLAPGTVVLDTSPLKAGVAAWAQEILPQGCAYVGLVPTTAAAHLEEPGFGLESARADLFKDGIFLIAAPAGAPGEALDAAAELARMAGANFLITDVAESDGLMSSTYLLPQLLSAALLNATLHQPGWQEGRKVAERPYHAATNLHEDAAGLRELALHNPEQATRILNGLIHSLVELRDAIQEKDAAALDSYFRSAFEGRLEWILQRHSGDWERRDVSIEKVSLGQRLLGSFFSRGPKDGKAGK